MKNLTLIIVLILSVSCSTIQHDASSPVIQLTKKRCLGKCPVYDLMIYKNGLVTYNGIDNVSKRGVHQFSIPTKKMEALNKLFDDSGFKDIEIKSTKGRDFPITQLTYQNKTVSFKGNVPKNVHVIIEELELITGI